MARSFLPMKAAGSLSSSLPMKAAGSSLSSSLPMKAAGSSLSSSLHMKAAGSLSSSLPMKAAGSLSSSLQTNAAGSSLVGASTSAVAVDLANDGRSTKGTHMAKDIHMVVNNSRVSRENHAVSTKREEVEQSVRHDALTPQQQQLPEMRRMACDEKGAVFPTPTAALFGRSREQNRLVAFLMEGIQNQSGGFLPVFGKPGTGKTLTAQTVVCSRLLVDECKKHNIRPRYVNAKQLPKTPDFKDLFGSTRPEDFGVLVLDEAEALTKARLDAIQTTWASKNSHQLVIAISNKFLPERDQSALVFTAYTGDELLQITKHCYPGLADEFSPSALTLCCVRMAGKEGDFRAVPQKLRQILAMHEKIKGNAGDTKVSIVTVSECFEADPIVEKLKTCTDIQQYVLLCIMSCLDQARGEARDLARRRKNEQQLNVFNLKDQDKTNRKRLCAVKRKAKEGSVAKDSGTLCRVDHQTLQDRLSQFRPIVIDQTKLAIETLESIGLIKLLRPMKKQKRGGVCGSGSQHVELVSGVDKDRVELAFHDAPNFVKEMIKTLKLV